jgi:hypothetical protein
MGLFYSVFPIILVFYPVSGGIVYAGKKCFLESLRKEIRLRYYSIRIEKNISLLGMSMPAI